MNDVSSPLLHAFATGDSGGDEDYAYGSTGNFSIKTFNTSTYWVNVVLQP